MSFLFLILLWSPAGGQNTRPAPDERYTVAFANVAPLNTDIFIAAEDGSDARPLLAHPEMDCNASFSPDENAPRCDAVNVGIRRFRAHLTQFLHSSRSGAHRITRCSSVRLKMASLVAQVGPDPRTRSRLIDASQAAWYRCGACSHLDP